MPFPHFTNTLNSVIMATSVVETITPAKAQEYLDKSGGNRNISKVVVDSYALTMKQGKWLLNGEPIVFDMNDTLLNGHHRLHAIIKSGVPIQTFVTRGVEHESYTTFDCGRHRTVGQLIGMQGVLNYNTIAASVTTSYKLANNFVVGENHGLEKGRGRTNTMMIELFNQDRDLYIDCGNFACEIRHKTNILEASIIGGVSHFLVRHCGYNIEFVKGFFRSVCSLDTCELQMLDLLRKRLIENKTTVRKTPRSVIVALLIKTWNFYVTGTTRKVLAFDASKEDYPKFIKACELNK